MTIPLRIIAWGVPRDHYVSLNFDVDEVRCTKKMAWFYCTYGSLRQYDLVESFPKDPTEFRLVLQHHFTAPAI